MDDPVDTLMVDVRASTQGFAQDVATMRAAFDANVTRCMEEAGPLLEKGLLQAIQRGSIGFGDLRRIALAVINDIAAQAVRTLFGGADGALGLGGLLGSVLGLPGRATGGPVSPGRGYLVGERGPELFVPTSAGRIEAAGSGGARNVRVSIAVAAPAGSSAPQALQRSARQVASAVRRALA